MDPTRRRRLSASFAGLLLFSVAAFMAVSMVGFNYFEKHRVKAVRDPNFVQQPKLIHWLAVWLAVAEAQKTKKAIFYIFTTPSCVPYRQMEKKILNDAQIAGFINDKFIPVLVVVNDSRPETAHEIVLKNKYGISEFPTFLVTKSDGQKIQQTTGYSSKDDVLKFLRDNGK